MPFLSFMPFYTASLPIQIHIILALIAIITSIAIVIARKGTSFHKFTGRIWALLMIGLALSSFGINSFDMPYGVSLIHILSVVILISIPLGIYHIRTGNLKAHKRAMIITMVGGILGAGLPAIFSPGRVLFKIFFGS